MRTILAVLICALVSGSAAARKIKGYIKLVDNDSALAGADIRNLDTRAVAMSSATGSYEIEVRQGDEIEVRLLGYEPKLVKLDVLPEGSFTIYLKKQIDVLEEVSVSALSLYQRDSITRRQAYEKILSRKPNHISAIPDTSFWITTPVGQQLVYTFPGVLSRVLEKRVGKGKKAYKFQKQFEAWEQEQFKAYIYNATIVEELTGLKDTDAHAFINAYPIEYLFARSASKIELNSWIKTNYADWNRKGRPVLIK